MAKKVPRNSVTFPLISQFVRSGTSVGANYCEADNAESKSDFRHKICICKKESKETIFWMRMLLEVCPDLSLEIKNLEQESTELNLIFNAIIKSCDQK